MSVAWYYSVAGATSPALTWDELRQAAADGKFGPEDFVWSADFGADWRKAGAMESLFPKPEPPPSPESSAEPSEPARRPEAPVAIELVRVPSPFATPDDGASEAETSGRRAVRCLDALKRGWYDTHRLLFSPFSLRRWLLFALCIMFTLLYRQSPLAFLTSADSRARDAQRLERLGLREVTSSGIFKLPDTFSALAVKDAPPLSNAQATELVGNAARETALAVKAWLGGSPDLAGLIAIAVVALLAFTLGVWFSARGFVIFFTRLYMPDNPLFASWVEGDAAARTLFRGLFGLRLLYAAAQIAFAAFCVQALAAAPLDVAVPPVLLGRVAGGILLFWIGDALLMGYVQDFVVPLIVLEKRAFLPALAAALRISGAWLLRYLVLLAGIFAALMALLMVVGILFGLTAYIAIAMLLISPFLGSLLLLPLHLLRRLWSLHIVFMLRPELRDASPEARMFRVLR